MQLLLINLQNTTIYVERKKIWNVFNRKKILNAWKKIPIHSEEKVMEAIYEAVCCVTRPKIRVICPSRQPLPNHQNIRNDQTIHVYKNLKIWKQKDKCDGSWIQWARKTIKKHHSVPGKDKKF